MKLHETANSDLTIDNHEKIKRVFLAIYPFSIIGRSIFNSGIANNIEFVTSEGKLVFRDG